MNPWLAFVLGVLIGSGAAVWWMNRRLRPIRAAVADLERWREELLEKWDPRDSG